MTRGEAQVHKVYYPSKNTPDNMFVVFVDDIDQLQKYRGGDTTIPLSEIVAKYEIFETQNSSKQGTLSTPADATLENEFDTKNRVDIIQLILHSDAELQKSHMEARQGHTNENN